MKQRSARARLFVWSIAASFAFAPAWAGARPAAENKAPAEGIGFMPVRRADAPRYVDGRVLVRYRDEAAKRPGEREAVRANVGGAVLRSFGTLPDLEALAIPADLGVEEAVAALTADPRVAYAEPDYTYTPQVVPNDQYFEAQWGLNNTGQEVNGYQSAGPGIDVDGPEAWEIATGSAEVVVAVIDTGMDVTHPDLAPNVWVNPGEVAGNGLDDDGNGFADDVNGWDFLNDDATVYDGARDTTNSTDFHGTHTSGTVGAAGNNGVGVAGVCWNVRLMSVKFLREYGSTSDAIACVDYVVAMKRRGVNVRAINASWGGGDYSTALHEALRATADEDILFCAASGNGGSDSRGDDLDVFPSYPACYDLPNVLSVGAWTRYNQPASFSNFGRASVDLLAPGAIIASTGPNGRYFYSNGTSMAAPHVTGAAALIASVAPGLTAVEIKDVIMSTAKPAVLAVCVTGGRLDLRAAVAVAAGVDDGGPGGEEPPPPPPPPPPVLTSVRYFPAKKMLVAYGSNLHENTTIVEVDGVALPLVRYPLKYRLPNGTWAAIEGKAPGRMKTFLPKGQTVQVTLFDVETEQRSTVVEFTR